MLPRVIIFGSTGMLGNYVLRYLVYRGFSVSVIDRHELDLSSADIMTIGEALDKVGSGSVPETVVVNCAGVIPQRRPSKLRDYVRINAEFPHLLAALARRRGWRLIHITTDCVFDGARGRYFEDDRHTETSAYGRSKSLGEPIGAAVIRTSIIGEELRNKASFLEWVRSSAHPVVAGRPTINGYVNCWWNGLTCLQLAKVISELIGDGIWWTGVRHVFSPQPVSKYELARLVAGAYGLDLNVEQIELDHPCDKTLDTRHPENASFRIPPIEEQIREQRDFGVLGPTPTPPPMP
ncbi:MAG: SDR family oxidoreductase [Sulfobacillus sp.]